jgi:thiamine biosynthesis protein ThiI
VEYLTVHYHELALKGANRPVFERTLRHNLAEALRSIGPAKVRSLAGRILIETEADPERVLARVTRVCGVAHAVRVEPFDWDVDAVGEAAARLVRDRAPATFRISAKRADKSFPMTSVELDREIGARVHEATGVPVRLRGPELDVQIMVVPRQMLLATERRQGPGGLPVGTGGRVAVLMSGGIDSPVAAWRLIRRGCRADLIHFHSHPLVDKTTQEKARDLAALLNEWQFQTRLHLVPLAKAQTAVKLECPSALRVILYRRFMVRIAERIARRRRCGALVTGESLGQVASQTLENLRTVDAVATMPVLRPLIGTDKQEIVNESRLLESYEISVRKDQDCCQLFVPPKPATRARPEEAEEAERALDVEALVEEAVEGTEVLDLP